GLQGVTRTLWEERERRAGEPDRPAVRVGPGGDSRPGPINGTGQGTGTGRGAGVVLSAGGGAVPIRACGLGCRTAEQRAPHAAEELPPHLALSGDGPSAQTRHRPGAAVPGGGGPGTRPGRLKELVVAGSNRREVPA